MIAAKTAGADWFEDPNIANYTASAGIAALTLAGIANGNASGGTAILSSGWAQTGYFELSNTGSTAAVCAVGDTLQVAGVYPANPQSRGRYGNTLKQFVVLPPNGYAQINGSATPGGPQFASGAVGGAGNGTFNATTGVYTSSGRLDALCSGRGVPDNRRSVPERLNSCCNLHRDSGCHDQRLGHFCLGQFDGEPLLPPGCICAGLCGPATSENGCGSFSRL